MGRSKSLDLIESITVSESIKWEVNNFSSTMSFNFIQFADVDCGEYCLLFKYTHYIAKYKTNGYIWGLSLLSEFPYLHTPYALHTATLK